MFSRAWRLKINATPNAFGAATCDTPALRTVDLKIEDIAFGGKGVARDNGKAVFIPFTIDGDLVSAKITSISCGAK